MFEKVTCTIMAIGWLIACSFFHWNPKADDLGFMAGVILFRVNSLHRGKS